MRVGMEAYVSGYEFGRLINSIYDPALINASEQFHSQTPTIKTIENYFLYKNNYIYRNDEKLLNQAPIAVLLSHSTSLFLQPAWLNLEGYYCKAYLHALPLLC